MVAIVAVLAAAAAVSGQAATQSENPARSAEYYESGLVLFNNGDFRGAVIQLRNALTQNEGNLSARVLLGRTYLGLGLGEEAEKQLKIARTAGADHALTLEPLGRSYLLQSKFKPLLEEIRGGVRHTDTKVAILFLRGQAHLELGNVNDAERLFEQAIALNPNHVETILGLVRLRLRLGQPDVAEKYADRALEIAPRDPDAWYFKGDVRRQRRDFTGALTYYDKAIELAIQHIPARISRAALLIDMGQYDRAAPDILYVRQRIPNDPYSLYLDAMILAHEGKKTKADEALRQASRALEGLSLDDITNHPPSMLVRGVISYARGQFDDAYPYLSRYVELMPHHVGARKLMGAILLRRNEPAVAINILKPAAEKAPNDVALLALLGNAYLKKGDFRLAHETFQKGVAMAPNELSLRKRLGFSLLAMGESRKAVDEFNKVVSASDGIDFAAVLLGMVQVRDGRYREALETATKLSRKEPGNPFPHNLAGIVHIKLEAYDEARSSFEKALKIAPKYFPAAFNLSALDLREGDLSAAKRRLRRVLRVHPSETRAMMELAAIAERESDITGAIRLLSDVRKIDARLISPQLKLIELYLRTNQFREAAMFADELETSHPGNFRVLEARAHVRLAAGDTAKAVEIYRTMSLSRGLTAGEMLRTAQRQMALRDFEGARNTLKSTIARSPGYFPAHKALVALEVREGGVERALEMAKLLRTAYPNSVIGDILTGDVLTQAGRYEEALTVYRAARAKDDSAVVALRIYNATRASGDARAALDGLTAWESSHPATPSVRRVLAAAYMSRGDIDRAVRAHETLAENSPNDAAVLNNLALLYLQKGDARARAVAQRAYKLAPTQPVLLDTYGWVLVQQGEPGEGLRLLRDAQARVSTSPEVGYHVAVALDRLGRHDEARRELRSALATNADFKDRDKAHSLFDRLNRK